VKITQYKIVYDIEGIDGKETHEVQGCTLPEYVRTEIDHYFNFNAEEEDNCDWLDDIDLENGCDDCGRDCHKYSLHALEHHGAICDWCIESKDEYKYIFEEEV
tara:strand:+ start:453 stop:761 length:309 start_codon:yes stop_codon:yes gene_type:complete